MFNLFLVEGNGFDFALVILGAYDPSDPWRVAHNVPALLIHDHLDHDIPREYLLGHGTSLAVLYFHLIFCGHHYLEDLVPDIHGFDAMLQVCLDPVFVSRVGMDDIPFFFALFHKELPNLKSSRKEIHRCRGCCHGNTDLLFPSHGV